jgi:hypothetical protein
VELRANEIQKNGQPFTIFSNLHKKKDNNNLPIRRTASDDNMVLNVSNCYESEEVIQLLLTPVSRKYFLSNERNQFVSPYMVIPLNIFHES